MFALRIQLPCDELHAAVGDEAYQSTLHVDREVQVDLCELPAEDAEVAAATSTASDTLPAGRSQNEDTSPSPFLALDAIEAEAEAEAEAVDEPDPEDAQTEIERVHVPFFAGNPKAELVSGSLCFFRFAHPGGTIGLRPPPIRSNLICLLAVPPSLGSVELISFLVRVRVRVRARVRARARARARDRVRVRVRVTLTLTLTLTLTRSARC